MTSDTPVAPDEGFLFASILADPRHRRVLDILREESSPIPERDLAVRLVTREEGLPTPDVSEHHVRPRLVALQHQILPKLRRVGWIERRPAGTVVLDRALPAELLSPGPLRGTDLGWHALATLLARPRRRDVLSIVADRDGPITLEELAAELAALREDSRSADEGDEELVAALYHVDLPRLGEAGLIEYDSDERTVAPDSVPPSLLDWLEEIAPVTR